MKTTAFFLLLGASLTVGCAFAPETKVADESTILSERCMATGSNLPRRDCRDVKTVDPTRVEMPVAIPPQRGGL